MEINQCYEESIEGTEALPFSSMEPGGAKGADLITLEQYTLDVVRGNITTALKLIKSLIAQSGKDPKAKARYEQCLLYYGGDDHKNGAVGALDNILYVKELLKKGDYVGVAIAATAATTNVVDCVSGDNLMISAICYQNFLILL
ncbi:hypothetical protein RIF29_05821 [Crotalaria pallida]|uniref:Uncharacterized protein n=1 Tax=Crotalaria pallida TaxID=3830 RepID=A0AAN9J533_CROPI